MFKRKKFLESLFEEKENLFCKLSYLGSNLAAFLNLSVISPLGAKVLQINRTPI